MTLRSMRRLVRPASITTVLVLLATACAKQAPQDVLAPDGPISRQVDTLFRPVFWIATFVFVFVEGLIVYAVIKFRDRPGREEPKQIHGNSKLEFTWTVIPALILLGIAFPTVATIFSINAKHEPNEVRIKVIGHQWWWEYQYLDTKPLVTTANEMIIPINRPIYLELESADVIHSFWVPKLAGKQDVVPERTNTLKLIADRPDQNYFGQCAEFCSISHANMRLRVLTKTEGDYDAWVKAQQSPGVTPTSPDAIEGQKQFLSNACIQCHAIGGTAAGGTLGPNLTHFADRTTFGSATFDNTDALLFDWVKHARVVKPGVLMPNFDQPLNADDPASAATGGTFKQLTDEQIRQIVAYLRSLV